MAARIKEGKKERRYEIGLPGGGKAHVFDPEECLHVGKHDKRYGLVYRFREYQNGRTRPYWITRRGTIDWDGKGGPVGLRTAAAEAAVKLCTGGDVPKSAVKRLREPGFWGRESFWKKTAEAHAEAMRMQIVEDVMES